MALQLTISEEKEVIIVRMNGRIDSFSIEELNAGFDKVMKTKKKNVLLIMKDLEYINSRGMGVLISFFKWVQKIGGLVKIAEVPLNIMQLFNLLGLDGLTLIYDSYSDAMMSFKRQQSKEKPIEPSWMDSEEVNETFEEKGEARRKVNSGKNLMPYIFTTILFIILIAILFIFFRTESNSSDFNDLKPIEDRLVSLEERFIGIQKQSQNIPEITAKLEGLTIALSRRVEELSANIDNLKKESTAPSIAKPVIIPESKPVPKAVEKKYHKVRNGESLYRIARRFNISIAELCNLNKLNPKKPIHPGQKLIVGFSGDP